MKERKTLRTGTCFEMSSLLNIPSAQLWVAVWDFTNVNKELAPFIKMTPPDLDLTAIAIDTIPLNEKLFDSYVLLLKILPVDIHHFGFKNIIPYERFDEVSTSVLMKTWHHSRILEDRGATTLLTDQVYFEHRIPFMGKILSPIYKGIFSHRHKYLRTKYNASV